jgi:hypothetical protein
MSEKTSNALVSGSARVTAVDAPPLVVFCAESVMAGKAQGSVFVSWEDKGLLVSATVTDSVMEGDTAIVSALMDNSCQPESIRRGVIELHAKNNEVGIKTTDASGNEACWTGEEPGGTPTLKPVAVGHITVQAA